MTSCGAILSLRSTSGLTNQLLDLVAESYDLAIRLGELEDSSMMAKRLASRRHYTCAAPEYLSAHGTPHTLSELDGYKLFARHFGLIGGFRKKEPPATSG